jgi:hypothetical protein
MNACLVSSHERIFSKAECLAAILAYAHPRMPLGFSAVVYITKVSASSPGIQARSWRRLDGIDLLRGLAIFFVPMNHVNIRPLGAHVPYTRYLLE